MALRLGSCGLALFVQRRETASQRGSLTSKVRRMLAEVSNKDGKGVVGRYIAKYAPRTRERQ